MNIRRFVIPDIHGCARTFRHLLDNIIGLQKQDCLFILGDIIDRGPRSKEVIDLILQLRLAGFRVLPVRGNHEDMLLKSCSDRTYFHLWMSNGGDATLKSFNVRDACEIPDPYREVIESFPYFIALDDFILVHAGLNFRIPDPFTDTDAMLWSRDRGIDKKLINGKRVISGHTPLYREDIRRTLTSDRIMLDNGCVYKNEPGLGSLAALELNSMALSFQENID